MRWLAQMKSLPDQVDTALGNWGELLTWQMLFFLHTAF